VGSWAAGWGEQELCGQQPHPHHQACKGVGVSMLGDLHLMAKWPKEPAATSTDAHKHTH